MSEQLDVMLSYSWSSQSLVEKVYDYLTCRGFYVWMDIKNGSMQHDNIYDAMATGISNASVVLVFMSQSYEQSENCKNELSLCADQKIVRIPILTEKDWKPTPSKWLALLTAGKLWIDMNESNYLSKMEELVRHIIYVVPRLALSMPPLLLSPHGSSISQETPSAENMGRTSTEIIPAIPSNGGGLLPTRKMERAVPSQRGGLLGRMSTETSTTIPSHQGGLLSTRSMGRILTEPITVTQGIKGTIIKTR